MKNLEPSFYFDLSIYKHAELFSDCQFVWEALQKITPFLKAYPLGKIETTVPQGTFLIDKERISIGKGTIVEPGAYIKGPCLIGENCTIRHGAYIRGDFIAGDRCVIGHDTEIKNTIMLNDAHAAHFAYLGDSILGHHVNLGAGTKCANLKLDQSPIVIHLDNERIPTHLRKFGAIIGDGSQLGCNSVTNPGTLIGKGVRCYPCINFGGFIPANRTVKSETKIVIF
jgi:NDP-sugar pyrophosphorylase family protein